MRKVLFIAYLFPPTINSGTQRSSKFCKYMELYNWSPIVLTVKNDPYNAQSNKSSSNKNLRVVRVEYASAKIASKIGKLIPVKSIREKVISAIEWRLRSYFGSSPYSLWVSEAHKTALDIFEQKKFDVIYASGAPWETFELAKKLSDELNIPYVLDYRDLWTNTDVEWASKQSDEKRSETIQLEKTLITDAAEVITVCEPIRKKLMKISNKDSKHFHVIYNGFDPDDFSHVKPFFEHNTQKIRIVYTGVWKKGYNLEELFNAIKILIDEHPAYSESLEIITAGYKPNVSNASLPNGMLRELGIVSHQTALSIMKSADILFLPVPTGEYALISLPGKMFEYLAVGKAILAVAPAESEVAKALEGAGQVIITEPNNIEALVTTLKTELSTFKKDDFSASRDIDCYNRKNLTKKLTEVLTAAVNSS